MVKEGARKTGKAIVVCTTPDVCKTPRGPARPPVPYQIVGNFSDSASVIPNVKFKGDPVFVLDQSIITKVKGDEPGSAKGVSSGTVADKVEPIEASKNVKAGGKRIVRHDDKCKMNNGNTEGKVIFNAGGKGSSPMQAPPQYDEMIQFVDKETGEPLVDYPYKLKTENGKVFEGRTDSDGCTIRMTSDKPEAIYLVEEWEEEDEKEFDESDEGEDE